MAEITITSILEGDTLAEGRIKINKIIDRVNTGLFYQQPGLTNALDVRGNAVITGNLFVGGTLTSVDEVNLVTTSNTITVDSERGLTNDGANRGVIFGWTDDLDVQKWGYFGFENPSQDFVYTLDVDEGDILDETFTVPDVALGTIRAYLDAGYITNAPILASDLSSTFVPVNGSSTISGTKTFSGTVVLQNDPTDIDEPVRAGRYLYATDGVAIGGASGAFNLLLDRSIGVDSSVIRDFGNQTISGIKTFTTIVVSDSIVGSVDSVTNGVYTIGTQDIYGLKTFRPAATNDGITVVGRSGGSNSYEVSLRTATLTTDRSVTFPDGDVTIPTGTILSGETNQSISGTKTFSSNILFSNSGTTKRGIQGTTGLNDYWFIGGSASESDAGFIEIATGDNGNEPIYARQYLNDPLSGSPVNREVVLMSTDGWASFPSYVEVATQATQTNQVVTAGRTINSGTGLTGGGDLTSDLTLNVDTSSLMTLTGDQTVAGTKTFSSTINGSISGNAGTATALETARTINGVPFDGTANVSISTGATGGGGDQAFYETDNSITSSYTVTSSRNALSVGPITILDGVTVTVPDGSAWVVV